MHDSGCFSWFWHNDFWLPQNVSWNQFEHVKNYNVWDLLHAIGAGLIFFVIKLLILHKTAFRKIGRLFGLRDEPRIPISKGASSLDKAALSKRMDVTRRQLEILLKKAGRPTTLDKFARSSLSCIQYGLLCTLGTKVLWNEPWPSGWWLLIKGMPFHPIENGVWWYYSIETGFYTSQLLMEFSDSHRKKDFAAMVFHHIATILLISFSWITNLTRMGSLVMIIHDLADPFLEAVKILMYLKHKAAEPAFICFIFVWIVTRLCIFPALIIFLFMNTALCPAQHLLRLLLLILLFLHLIWTGFIMKMCLKRWFTAKGASLNDSRSDDEDSD